MPDNDLQSGFAAKMLGELLGKIHRPVLSTGAAERNHQILETSILIRIEARSHKRDHIGEELMGTFLLCQVFNDGGILSREVLESFFASRIRDAASIEDEPAAVSRLVFRHRAAMKRETENSEDQMIGVRGQTLQLLGPDHRFERIQESRHCDGKLDVV